MRIISWNVYYGSLFGTTVTNIPLGVNQHPMESVWERVQYILLLAAAYNVEVVVLQELPGTTPPQLSGGNGRIQLTHQIGIGNQLQVDFDYITYAEQHTAYPYARASASNRSYGIFLNNRTHVALTGGPNYYLPNSFSTYLPTILARPPIVFQVSLHGVTYSIFNWHNEVGANAAAGLGQFISNLNTAPPPNPILAGDLNAGATTIDGYFNNNWSDVTYYWPNREGLDHILFFGNATPVPGLNQQLDFQSDHHFPVSAQL